MHSPVAALSVKLLNTDSFINLKIIIIWFMTTFDFTVLLLMKVEGYIERNTKHAPSHRQSYSDRPWGRDWKAVLLGCLGPPGALTNWQYYYERPWGNNRQM